MLSSTFGSLLVVSLTFACQREAASPQTPAPVAAAPEAGPGVIPEPSEAVHFEGDAAPVANAATLATPQVVEPGVVQSGGAPPRGKLAPGVLQARLDAAMPALRACYERGLAKNPALRGHVQVDFVIAPEGAVMHAAASDVDDALTEPAVIDCLLAEVRALEFPKPSGGRVFANFPLDFEPPTAPFAPPAPAAP